MENHPSSYPRGRVSYYKTEALEQPMISEMFRRDKQLLSSSSVEFEIEEQDGFTFIVVDGCSSHELAEEILG